ncbi:hypothetical protein EDD16DRAFT_1587804 [Pisolithus croceorrhizus]|nr:hypothetical protein EDD16DRAFT_1587804 [Pisolithus croceorrhizus]
MPRANRQLRVDTTISRCLRCTRTQQTTRGTKLDVTTQLSPPRSTQVAVVIAAELLILIRSASSQDYCLSARMRLDRIPHLGEGSPGSEHLHGRFVYCCRDPGDNDGYYHPNADRHLKYPTKNSNVRISVHRVVQRGRPHWLRVSPTFVSPRKSHHFVINRSWAISVTFHRRVVVVCGSLLPH